jgi:hypothetical protein
MFEDGCVVYFAGDTNVFTDMQLIAELYKPDLAFLPIGDLFTMSPREAAVACLAGAGEARRSDALRHVSAAHGICPSQLQQLAKDTKIWELTPEQTVIW